MCYSSPFPSLWTDVKSSPVKKSKNTSSKSIDNTPTLGRDFTDTSARFSQSNKEPACGSNYFDPTSTADDHENADMHSTSAGEEKLERLGCDSDGEDGLFWLQAAEILSQQESVDDNTIASLAFNSWDKEEELEATVIFQALVAGELT